MSNTISWLVSVPAGDINFKSALERATRGEIEQAIEIVKKQEKGVKTKIAALMRRLRKI